MTNIVSFPDTKAESADARIARTIRQQGEIVPLPFVDLPSILMTMKMLRKFPDQSMLDKFNRTRH